MTALPTETYLSPEEYLLLERAAAERHGYVNGEMFAMAGSSMKHVQICMNLGRRLGNRLEKSDCSPYQSDLRVHIPATGMYTYPDIIVVCGEPRLVPDGFLDTLINPHLIIEVLSKSTADDDRGAKFDHYKTIESLKEYLLGWQDKKRVARYTRESDGSWNLKDFIGDDAIIELSSIGCSLSIEEIYDKVNID